MKPTASNPNTGSQQQQKGPRQETGAGRQEPAARESASQKATEKARRGDPLPVENKRDRSPKQENL